MPAIESRRKANALSALNELNKLDSRGRANLELIEAVAGIGKRAGHGVSGALKIAAGWLPDDSIKAIEDYLDRGHGDMLEFLLEDGRWDCVDYLLRGMSRIQEEQGPKVKRENSDSTLGQIDFEREVEELSNAQYSDENALPRLAGAIRCLRADAAEPVVQQTCQTLLKRASTVGLGESKDAVTKMAKFLYELKDKSDLAFAALAAAAKTEEEKRYASKAIATCLVDFGRDGTWFPMSRAQDYAIPGLDFAQVNEEIAAINEQGKQFLAWFDADTIQRNQWLAPQEYFDEDIRGALDTCGGALFARVNLLVDRLFAGAITMEDTGLALKSIAEGRYVEGYWEEWCYAVEGGLLLHLNEHDASDTLKVIGQLQEAYVNTFEATAEDVLKFAEPLKRVRTMALNDILRDPTVQFAAGGEQKPDPIPSFDRFVAERKQMAQAVQQQMQRLVSGSGAENLNNQKEALSALEDLAWKAAKADNFAAWVDAMVEGSAESEKASVTDGCAMLANVICNMASSGKASDLRNALLQLANMDGGKTLSTLLDRLYKNKAKDPGHKNFRHFLQVFSAVENGKEMLLKVFEQLPQGKRHLIAEQAEMVKGLQGVARQFKDFLDAPTLQKLRSESESQKERESQQERMKA